MTDDEREIRAFEAIIASQIHRDRDPMNLDDLPELTESQRTKMESLPADLVQRLWDIVDLDDDDCPAHEPPIASEEEEEELVGMNRADEDEMDDETRRALDVARKEIIESMRRRRREDGGANT